MTTGSFHCPTCGGDRTFRLRRPRARLRLAGLPLAPGRRGDPVVDCGSCADRFPLGVLDIPTTGRLEELLGRGTRTASAYVLTGLLAGGERWSPEEIREAQAALRRVLGPDYAAHVLAADLAAHREGSDLGVLADLAASVSVLGREALLRGLADLVLVLDRSGSPDWSRLRDVAAALGITPTHLRGVVEEASARARE